MSKAGKKIIEGLNAALAYARVDALLRRSEKPKGTEITQYDWGYRDGLMAARDLFGKEVKPKRPPAKPETGG